ncbi:MAG: D-2-hydroxyacid dehydrogenase family protein [Burkholderiales bacterium]
MIIAIPDDYHGLVPTLDSYKLLQGHDVRVSRDAAPPFDRLVAVLEDADIIVPIRERTRFTKELIAALPNLKLFSQTGRSTRHIDVQACTARGIAVAAGSHASPYTVAEQTWALIFASLRPIAEDAALMKRGEWRGAFHVGVHGKTLGVLGLGMIGRLVAATGASLGMRVLVWGRTASCEAARAAGYSVGADQRALFSESDVLSINLRYTPETRGIVKAADLAAMKPDALLVNAARAEIIESGALEQALRNGRPGRAAVDVYENEPVLHGDHPLLRLPNAVCTPHSAWVEKTTYELYLGEAIENAVAFAAGRPVRLVNPEVLGNA